MALLPSYLSKGGLYGNYPASPANPPAGGLLAGILSRFKVPPAAGSPPSLIPPCAEAEAWTPPGDAPPASAEPSSPPPGWDAAGAIGALTECEAAIDHALAATLTPARRRMAEVCRSVIRTHAAQHDPALWSDASFLREQFARWGIAPPRAAACR